MNKKILIFAIITLALDQITKTIITFFMNVNESWVIINNFFSLTLCHNFGVAWGFLKDAKIVIIVGTLIALFLIYHFVFCFKKSWRNNMAFGLLLGGLAGNLIDRIIFGYVRDFFDFYIFKYDYPVFNVADIAIVCGVILLIYAVIKGEDVNENRSRKK